MTGWIVLLSGPLAVGKSAVADALTREFQYRKISSGGYLNAIARERDLPATRVTLQRLGDQLDEESGFAWLVDDVADPQIHSESDEYNWYVDAVRKPQQVQLFRRKFPVVLHAHLTAPEEVLRARFAQRARKGDEVEAADSYETAVGHPNEQSSRALIEIADLVIDLGKVEATKAAAMIAQHVQRCT